jgi:hypothetical protein
VSVRNRSVSDRHHEIRSQVLCYVDHRRYETVSILGPFGVPSPTPRFLPNRAFTLLLKISSPIHALSRFYLVPCREP